MCVQGGAVVGGERECLAEGLGGPASASERLPSTESKKNNPLHSEPLTLLRERNALMYNPHLKLLLVVGQCEEVVVLLPVLAWCLVGRAGVICGIGRVICWAGRGRLALWVCMNVSMHGIETSQTCRGSHFQHSFLLVQLVRELQPPPATPLPHLDPAPARPCTPRSQRSTTRCRPPCRRLCPTPAPVLGPPPPHAPAGWSSQRHRRRCRAAVMYVHETEHATVEMEKKLLGLCGGVV